MTGFILLKQRSQNIKKTEAGFGQGEHVPGTPLDQCFYNFKPHKEMGKLYEL